MEGINPDLDMVVRLALSISPIDFGVAEGIRSKERQLKLYNEGLSDTLDSKHLIGNAVDLYAYKGKALWDLESLAKVGQAMREAAKQYGVGLCWGGAWLYPDIRHINKSLADMHQTHIRKRRNAGLIIRTIDRDFPHFELS